MGPISVHCTLPMSVIQPNKRDEKFQATDVRGSYSIPVFVSRYSVLRINIFPFNSVCSTCQLMSAVCSYFLATLKVRNV